MIFVLEAKAETGICKHPRTGQDLCKTTWVSLSSAKKLSAPDTEYCLAVSILAIDLQQYIEETYTPLMEKEGKEIDRLNILASKGVLTDEEYSNLGRRINKYNYKIDWFEKVSQRAIILGNQFEQKCLNTVINEAANKENAYELSKRLYENLLR